MNLNSEIARWKDDAAQHIKDAYVRDKFLAPVAFILTPKKDCMIIVGGFTTDKEKEQFIQLVRNKCKQANAVAIVMGVEAWSLSYKQEEAGRYSDSFGNSKIRPSESADRKECIIITFETKLTSETIMLDISNGTIRSESKLSLISGKFKDVLCTPTFFN